MLGPAMTKCFYRKQVYLFLPTSVFNDIPFLNGGLKGEIFALAYSELLASMYVNNGYIQRCETMLLPSCSEVIQS